MITPLFKEKTFKNLTPTLELMKCKEYAKLFNPKDSLGIQMVGKVGTGKTTLLAAICNELMDQTHQSIRANLLEEAYEAADAIDRMDLDNLKEELGDVLLQVVFHARMEQEEGRFDLDAVADGVCKKLIYRHPHVFGDVSVSGTGE